MIILNENLEQILVLDEYKSLIWTERYSEYGDFELYIPMQERILDFVRHNNYIWHESEECLMIIESIKLVSDLEEGDYLVVTGRSLESILTRRIIWTQTVLSGNLQNGIKKLLNDSIIAPTDASRKIPNFTFKPSTDSTVTELTVSAQFTGDNLYEAIKKLCDNVSIGFKVTLTEDDKFQFELYNGADRSYSQFNNPFVVFSPTFENIINSNYLNDESSHKTVTLVAGEGEGLDRKTTTVAASGGAKSGLYRREMYTDARDITSEVDGEKLTDAQYIELLKNRGAEYLTEKQVNTAFEGQTETTKMFVYGEDFFKGDIVQVANAYGIEARARISEIVLSQTVDGIERYPTFVILN